MVAVKGQYFDRHHDRVVDLREHGCDLSEWERGHGQASFARHPEGFMVFLPPTELDQSDEYRASDPYEVESGLTGEFHARRVECTLALLHEALRRTGPKPRILDVGCGQGHITALIKKAVPQAELYGLDYSLAAIQYAHEHFTGIEFIVASAYDPPYAGNYFDIVVCNNLWEHVADPLMLLAQLARVMTPNAFLIISTPSRYRWANIANVLRGRPIEFMSSHHVTEYTVGQVIEQLRYGGFELVKVFSKPYRTSKMTFELAKRLFALFVKLTGSHHQLESSVFYLSQRSPKG